MRPGRQSRWQGAIECQAWIIKTCVRIQALAWALEHEDGQDLVEYAIVAALISLAAIASMKNVAVLIAAAYNRLGLRLGTYIT
jgi:Flp pilus assembly pilin Flp